MFGQTFSSKEGDDSRDIGIKLVSFGSNELGLDAHSTVGLTITSRLKSSDSNLASHAASSFISSLFSLVNS